MTKYETILQQLKSEIAIGLYPTGTLLPSLPELEKRFQVSQITVRRVLTILDNKGIIRKKRGRGNGSEVLRLDAAPPDRPREATFGYLDAPRALQGWASDFPAMGDGIIAELAARNSILNILPILTEAYPSAMSCARELATRRTVDGVFVPNTQAAEAFCDFLKTQGFPFVRILSYDWALETMRNKPYALVAIDETAAFRNRLSSALDSGIRRVVLVGDGDDFIPSRTAHHLGAAAKLLQLPLRSFHAEALDDRALLTQLHRDEAPEVLTVLGSGVLPRVEHLLGTAEPPIRPVVYMHYSMNIPTLFHRYELLRRPLEEIGRAAARLLFNLYRSGPDATAQIVYDVFESQMTNPSSQEVK